MRVENCSTDTFKMCDINCLECASDGSDACITCKNPDDYFEIKAEEATVGRCIKKSECISTNTTLAIILKDNKCLRCTFIPTFSG